MLSSFKVCSRKKRGHSRCPDGPLCRAGLCLHGTHALSLKAKWKAVPGAGAQWERVPGVVGAPA